MGITTQGITTQGITAGQIGDSNTSRNYFFISTLIKANKQNKQENELFSHSKIFNNKSTVNNNRFMTAMNPFMA